jgi:hypothetical protein
VPSQGNEASASVPIELKHLRYAEAAERCGSFREAADQIESQHSVSHQSNERRARADPLSRPRDDRISAIALNRRVALAGHAPLERR